MRHVTASSSVRPRSRTLRALAAATSLVAALSLSGCGIGGAATSTTSAAQTTAAGGDSGGVLSDSTSEPTLPPKPTPSPTASTPPAPPASNVKFYVEDHTYWYQDDSITNQDAVSGSGNLQGFRTHQGGCLGYVKRDIEAIAYGTTLDDATLTDIWVGGNSEKLDNFTETGRETIALVRDDSGYMEGMNISFTGTYNSADGATPVTGYHYARAVGASGLVFTARLMCKQGSDPGLEVWHQILQGIRLEGITAGPLSQ